MVRKVSSCGKASDNILIRSEGVPRILEGTIPPHLFLGDNDWEPYIEYLENSRINVNVRQVFPRGFEPCT